MSQKLIPVLLSLMLATLVHCAEFYSSKYDNFDIQPLLSNDRILVGYTKCFLDRGPCTPDSKAFKAVIPEALETKCGKCSPKQKELIKTVITVLRERHPDSWKELLDKYDKERKFRDTVDKFLEED
uniref:Putative chemosensory protein 5 n=1 Tax=Conopomorpha sinensis TaxID=940481 RepID=A0A5Q2USR4_9NEOP|nr:putative chemosensory protein 5 [Conopomorpha sinensis]